MTKPASLPVRGKYRKLPSDRRRPPQKTTSARTKPGTEKEDPSLASLRSILPSKKHLLIGTGVLVLIIVTTVLIVVFAGGNALDKAGKSVSSTESPGNVPSYPETPYDIQGVDSFALYGDRVAVTSGFERQVYLYDLDDDGNSHYVYTLVPLDSGASARSQRSTSGNTNVSGFGASTVFYSSSQIVVSDPSEKKFYVFVYDGGAGYAISTYTSPSNHIGLNMAVFEGYIASYDLAEDGGGYLSVYTLRFGDNPVTWKGSMEVDPYVGKVPIYATFNDVTDNIEFYATKADNATCNFTTTYVYYPLPSSQDTSMSHLTVNKVNSACLGRNLTQTETFRVFSPRYKNVTVHAFQTSNGLYLEFIKSIPGSPDPETHNFTATEVAGKTIKKLVWHGADLVFIVQEGSTAVVRKISTLRYMDVKQPVYFDDGPSKFELDEFCSTRYILWEDYFVCTDKTQGLGDTEMLTLFWEKGQHDPVEVLSTRRSNYTLSTSVDQGSGNYTYEKYTVIIENEIYLHGNDSIEVYSNNGTHMRSISTASLPEKFDVKILDYTGRVQEDDIFFVGDSSGDHVGVFLDGSSYPSVTLLYDIYSNGNFSTPFIHTLDDRILYVAPDGNNFVIDFKDNEIVSNSFDNLIYTTFLHTGLWERTVNTSAPVLPAANTHAFMKGTDTSYTEKEIFSLYDHQLYCIDKYGVARTSDMSAYLAQDEQLIHIDTYYSPSFHMTPKKILMVGSHGTVLTSSLCHVNPDDVDVLERNTTKTNTFFSAAQTKNLLLVQSDDTIAVYRKGTSHHHYEPSATYIGSFWSPHAGDTYRIRTSLDDDSFILKDYIYSLVAQENLTFGDTPLVIEGDIYNCILNVYQTNVTARYLMITMDLCLPDHFEEQEAIFSVDIYQVAFTNFLRVAPAVSRATMSMTVSSNPSLEKFSRGCSLQDGNSGTPLYIQSNPKLQLGCFSEYTGEGDIIILDGDNPENIASSLPSLNNVERMSLVNYDGFTQDMVDYFLDRTSSEFTLDSIQIAGNLSISKDGGEDGISIIVDTVRDLTHIEFDVHNVSTLEVTDNPDLKTIAGVVDAINITITDNTAFESIDMSNITFDNTFTFDDNNNVVVPGP